ncbi:hypothetical protein V1499_18515 [Neobacillus sp. SCS-31]|uniref:hypothetical protein n=1 Tax=Neobacillus oceani TaxID=3115292 RepID=UPI003906B180
MKKAFGILLSIFLLLSAAPALPASAGTQKCNPYVEKIYKEIDKMGYQIHYGGLDNDVFMVTDGKGFPIFTYGAEDKETIKIFTSVIDKKDWANSAKLFTLLGFPLSEKVLIAKMDDLFNGRNMILGGEGWKSGSVYAKEEKGGKYTVIAYNGPGYHFIAPYPSTKVMWGKDELKKGQIGRATILKDTQLYKLSDDTKLTPTRKLKKGEIYRIYNYKPLAGGLYGLGGGHYVKKADIKYETPSKDKKDAVDRVGKCTQSVTDKYKTLFIGEGSYPNDPLTNTNHYQLYYPQITKEGKLTIEIKKGSSLSKANWESFRDKDLIGSISLVFNYEKTDYELYNVPTFYIAYADIDPEFIKYHPTSDSVMVQFDINRISVANYNKDSFGLIIKPTKSKNDFLLIYK